MTNQAPGPRLHGAGSREPVQTHRRLFEKLRTRFDREGRVRLLLSSEDVELCRYFDAVQATGSVDMDDEGTVWVKIHDSGHATKGCLLEECAHALQFLRFGSVPLSVDSTERDEREWEVATCLLEKSHRLEAPDIRHYTEALELYRLAG